jgi:hypothetical protein
MSFVNFYLFNDQGQVVQLAVYDCVDQNHPLPIASPDYPGQSPFPVVDGGQTAVLRATALQDGGNTATVSWDAQPVHQQGPTQVEDGKIYNISNGYEKG